MCALWFAVALATLVACSKSQTVNLADRITLKPNRPLTLLAPEPLEVVGADNRLWIQIVPPDALNRPPKNGEWGVRRADGALVRISAVLVGADSSFDPVSCVGYAGTEVVTVGKCNYDPPFRPPYKAVRITASDSLTVAKIRWQSHTSAGF